LPPSKGVVSAADPAPGSTGSCTSGQTSGEQCGITVQSTEVIAGGGVTSYAEEWSRMAAGFGISIVTG
jgi:hypothetical protein